MLPPEFSETLKKFDVLRESLEELDPEQCTQVLGILGKLEIGTDPNNLMEHALVQVHTKNEAMRIIGELKPGVAHFYGIDISPPLIVAPESFESILSSLEHPLAQRFVGDIGEALEGAGIVDRNEASKLRVRSEGILWIIYPRDDKGAQEFLQLYRQFKANGSREIELPTVYDSPRKVRIEIERGLRFMEVYVQELVTGYVKDYFADKDELQQSIGSPYKQSFVDALNEGIGDYVASKGGDLESFKRAIIRSWFGFPNDLKDILEHMYDGETKIKSLSMEELYLNFLFDMSTFLANRSDGSMEDISFSDVIENTSFTSPVDTRPGAIITSYPVLNKDGAKIVVPSGEVSEEVEALILKAVGQAFVPPDRYHALVAVLGQRVQRIKKVKFIDIMKGSVRLTVEGNRGVVPTVWKIRTHVLYIDGAFGLFLPQELERVKKQSGVIWRPGRSEIIN